MQRAYHHERCLTAEVYRWHDDEDDDDGENYFIGQRGVKRSRRPHSHGSRSRRLKSAATGRQTVRPNLHPPPVTVTLGRLVSTSPHVRVGAEELGNAVVLNHDFPPLRHETPQSRPQVPLVCGSHNPPAALALLGGIGRITRLRSAVVGAKQCLT